MGVMLKMKEVYLTKLKKLKKLRERAIHVFDVETDIKGFFKLVSYAKLQKSKKGNKEYETFVKTFFSFDKFIEFMFNSDVDIVYCYNIKFDSRFLPNYLLKNLDVDFHIIESSSQLLGIILKRKRNEQNQQIIFKDFFPFCKTSLDKISKKFGCKFRKYPDFQENDEIKLKQLWNEFFDTCNLFELQMHCENDVKITAELIAKYRELVFDNYAIDVIDKKIYSLASLTMKVYRTNYIQQKIYNPFIKVVFNSKMKKWEYYINKHLESFVRKTYKGGYCGNRDNRKHYDLISFDINSSYPFQASRLKFPINEAIYTTSEDLFNDNTIEIEGFCNVDIDFMNGKYFIPIIRDDGKLGKTDGFWSGNITSIEFKYIKKYNIPYSFNAGYYFEEYDKSESVKRFCLEQYERKRQEDLINPLSALREIYKTLMNALTGKFGQKMLMDQKTNYKFILKDEFERLNNDFDSKQICSDKLDYEIWYIYKKILKESIKTYQIPSWISLITALGRIQLLDMIHETNAICWDSDSVYAERKYLNPDFIHECENSKIELGKWKIEHYITKLRSLAPKFYCFHDLKEDKHFIKLKGIPNNFFNEELFEKIWNFQDGNIITIRNIPRFLTIKESINRVNVLESDILVKYDEITKNLNPIQKM